MALMDNGQIRFIPGMKEWLNIKKAIDNILVGSLWKTMILSIDAKMYLN